MKLSIKANPTMPDALWSQIPDEHALRVGQFMAAWSLIEFKLECVIWHLIGADQHDLRPLTARLDARPKTDTIDELLGRRNIPSDQKDAWKAAKHLIAGLGGNRNWLAHGVWVPYPIGGTGLMQTRKGGKASGIIARLKPITISDLDGWLAQAAQAIEHLNKLLPEKLGEQPPSPDTP